MLSVTAEDPDFARSCRPGRVERLDVLRSVGARDAALGVWTAVVAAVALGVLMLVVSGPGTALVVAMLATMIFVIRRRGGAPGRRGGRGDHPVRWASIGWCCVRSPSRQDFAHAVAFTATPAINKTEAVSSHLARAAAVVALPILGRVVMIAVVS